MYSLLTFCTVAILRSPSLPADTVGVRGPRTQGVIVLMLALEVVLTVLLERGGGDTVGGEVKRESLVTETLPTVQVTPAPQLPGLAPPLVSSRQRLLEV